MCESLISDYLYVWNNTILVSTVFVAHGTLLLHSFLNILL